MGDLYTIVDHNGIVKRRVVGQGDDGCFGDLVTEEEVGGE